MSADAGLLLEDQLCFALYSAARAATGAYRDGLAEIGLTYTQYVTLIALWETDGQGVCDLGSRLRLDSGTLSPLLKRLADLGLIERRRSSADERRVTIHLTPAGRALESRAAGVREGLYADLEMTADELVTLRSLTLRFCAAAGR